MQAQSSFSKNSLKQRLQASFDQKWDSLTDDQKKSAKKAWAVLTYKWRWQIAMNIPYLVIFALDRTIPAVHEFDMAIISTVVARLPLPEFLESWLGFG